MARTIKSVDLSVLAVQGYRFSEKVKINSLSKVTFGEKLLACKIVRKKIAVEDKARLEIIRKLSHPHILSVHSVLQNGTLIFVFMSWIDGGDLLSHVKANGMIVESVANVWFYQLVCGVKFLHDNGYAHCNLSCSCVMISRNSLKIAGLNQLRRSCDGEKILLKPRKSSLNVYCAPEMNQRRSCLPKKCDVFALGVILFIILNATSPFNNSSLTQLIDDQLKRNIKLRTSNIQILSVACQAMLLTLLEPDQDVRWSIGKIHGMKWLSKFIDTHGDS